MLPVYQIIAMPFTLAILLSSSLVLAESSATMQTVQMEPISSQTQSKTSNKPKQSAVDFSNFGGANTKEDSHEMWLALREQYFSDRPIIEDASEYIRLKAPSRAENDALVPVFIDLKAEGHHLKDPFSTVYLIVDVNPAPMGGIFKLANKRVMEELRTSVRVNGYTYIRVVGETASGKLYMAKQWVKSTGAGCSAPPGLDQDEHKKRMGKMRIKQMGNKSVQRLKVLRLIISHPNNTGMQRDQLSTLFIPQLYVKHVDVTFNKEPILEADTTFTLSENPNFSFTFDPDETGVLHVGITDNQDNFFSLDTHINGDQK